MFKSSLVEEMPLCLQYMGVVIYFCIMFRYEEHIFIPKLLQ